MTTPIDPTVAAVKNAVASLGSEPDGVGYMEAVSYTISLYDRLLWELAQEARAALSTTGDERRRALLAIAAKLIPWDEAGEPPLGGFIPPSSN